MILKVLFTSYIFITIINCLYFSTFLLAVSFRTRNYSGGTRVFKTKFNIGNIYGDDNNILLLYTSCIRVKIRILIYMF